MKGSLAAVLLVVLSACNPDSGSTPTVNRQADFESGETAVYHCTKGTESFQLVTRARPDGLSVFLPPGYAEPYQILTASGNDRAGVFANDRISVVPGDNSAQLTLAEGDELDCRYDRRASIWEQAKLDGVDIRGLGNEPGWTLEIRLQRRVDFEYDYGSASVSLPVIDTSSDPGARWTRITAENDSQQLIVTLSGQRCLDSMSDEVFSTRIVVKFDGRTFQGCGRSLH